MLCSLHAARAWDEDPLVSRDNGAWPAGLGVGAPQSSRKTIHHPLGGQPSTWCHSLAGGLAAKQLSRGLRNRGKKNLQSGKDCFLTANSPF